MNLIMRLLEIVIQLTIIVLFSHSILTYWGFETNHFIMITEGKVPKRVQTYNPSKINLSEEKKLIKYQRFTKDTDEDQLFPA